MQIYFVLTLGLLASFLSVTPDARADFFNLHRFVAPGSGALGVEPVLTFTGDAGIGINARYTRGVTELINAGGLIGTGGGTRKFRAGGYAVFDFFPDLEDQPGLGLAVTGTFYELIRTNRFDVLGVPYLHNAFEMSSGKEFDPYVAVPVGVTFGSSDSDATASFIVGSLIEFSTDLFFSVEFGIEITNSFTYFSGGVVLYH